MSAHKKEDYVWRRKGYKEGGAYKTAKRGHKTVNSNLVQDQMCMLPTLLFHLGSSCGKKQSWKF